MTGNSEYEGERIAKIIARAGICSRRDAERLVTDGRVTVNGKTIETPAINLEPDDIVAVDGERIPARGRPRLWRYHKPAGLVTTHKDERGRPTVFESLPTDLPRVMGIGRLDLKSEGLLLLTNHGDLARTLELPSTGWVRRYRVRVHGHAEPKALDALAHGITVNRVRYGSILITVDRKQTTNTWLTVSLKEGKNREIRRIMEHLNLQVSRLIRISFGPFQLGNLPAGDIAEVPQKVLKEQVGNTLPV